jgi:hypothetical protein
MFSPDSPPPSKYHHKKAPASRKEEKPFFVRLLPWLFIVAGIVALVTMIVKMPSDNRRLVCDNRIVGQRSLITFGTCRKE